MLIILPPSETKVTGGNEGSQLDLATLSFPSLTPIRASIISDLAALDSDDMLSALGISATLRSEAQSNYALFSSPTMPALSRYTGVLFDAPSPNSLPQSATQRIAIGSALFSLVRAEDRIPHYRLSASAHLPACNGDKPTMKKRWGTSITQALADNDELIVDLRSKSYQQLGPIANAITVRVESVREDGTRRVVSHFNKHFKGHLTRLLSLVPNELVRKEDIIEVVAKAGLSIEDNKKNPAVNETLTLVV